MSKNSRTEAIAKAMVETSQSAATMIEACENEHQLTQNEAYDVLAGAVVSYLLKDGEDNNHVRAHRLLKFIDHLGDYAEEVLGINFEDDVEVS